MKNCPSCNADLEVIVRADVEIDRCTNCYGIWLDDGELELVVSRSDPPPPMPAPRPEQAETSGGAI